MIEILGTKYITDKEASHRYGYSKQWFQRKRWEHQGPPFVKLNGKGRVLYPLTKADDWFNENLK